MNTHKHDYKKLRTNATMVYVCSCNDSFDFREAEHLGDYDAIKEHSIKTRQVYSLDEFQEALNDESLSLDNAFILID